MLINLLGQGLLTHHWWSVSHISSYGSPILGTSLFTGSPLRLAISGLDKVRMPSGDALTKALEIHLPLNHLLDLLGVVHGAVFKHSSS